MVRSGYGQPTPFIRDLYHGALAAIMAEHNIEPSQQVPSHIVGADADFSAVSGIRTGTVGGETAVRLTAIAAIGRY